MPTRKWAAAKCPYCPHRTGPQAPRVKEHDARVEVAQALGRFATVVRLPNDLEIGLALEECAQPAAVEGVVDDQQDPGRGARGATDLAATGYRRLTPVRALNLPGRPLLRVHTASKLRS